jgi:hypothetical protein
METPVMTSSTSKPSRAELVAELRADAIRIGKAQGIDKERLSLWRAAEMISALTAPLSADREAVDATMRDALAEIRDGMVASRHEISVDDWIEIADAALAKADAILALTAPRGAENQGSSVADSGGSPPLRAAKSDSDGGH